MNITPELTRYQEAARRHQAALEELVNAIDAVGEGEALILGRLTAAEAVRRAFTERLTQYPAVVRLDAWRKWRRESGAAG